MAVFEGTRVWYEGLLKSQWFHFQKPAQRACGTWWCKENATMTVLWARVLQVSTAFLKAVTTQGGSHDKAMKRLTVTHSVLVGKWD
jgi:hypothetical protein